MMTEVVKAEASDLDALSELIAEAFHNLPPSPWLISDDAARREILPAYFRIYLEHGLARGLVYSSPPTSGTSSPAAWTSKTGATVARKLTEAIYSGLTSGSQPDYGGQPASIPAADALHRAANSLRKQRPGNPLAWMPYIHLGL